MLEQPENPSASNTKQQVFDHYLHRLQSEIHTILSSEADYEERVKATQNDLDVFRRQCFALADENRHLIEENTKIKERLSGYESMIKNSEQRIICLIDGDGTIFSIKLLSQGYEGGRRAALRLSESVQSRLSSSSSPRPLWVYIFYNKRGLVEALRRAGSHYREAHDRFEDFVVGFNQSSERFIMVDVGSGKEAADAKIKVYLEDYGRSLHTFKILFGGCHDTGYIPTLRSLLTSNSGYSDKIMLLPGYDEIPYEFKDLQLPALVIPELFIHEKLTRASSGPFGPPPGLSTVSDSLTPNGDTYVSGVSPTSSYPPSSNSVTLSPRKSPKKTASLLERMDSPPPDNAFSYRLALQTPPKHNPTSPVKSNGEDIRHSNSLRRPKKPMRLDFTIALHKNNPRPCTSFYLGNNGCKNGDDCRFSHEYELEDDDEEMLRTSAKKWPCSTITKNEICPFGDDCFYGHTCPFKSRCRYFKLGECKFGGVSVHRET